MSITDGFDAFNAINKVNLEDKAIELQQKSSKLVDIAVFYVWQVAGGSVSAAKPT